MPESVAEPLEQAIYDEQIEHMAALFSRLNESQRELLRLRFTAGLGYAEIGAVLGRSQAAVKMAVLRLLRQLHEKWEPK
jgi:RNA polymerase sigma factor (sigma-70 family)